MEQKLISISVDGKKIEVDPGMNLIDACALAGASVPSLCFMKDISANASCGVCVVEVEGAKALVRSCVQKPVEGMKIRTAGPRVMSARRTAVELLLANHPTDCLSCIRSGTCELRVLAETLGVRASRYPKLKKFPPPDTSTEGLVRDDSKCILCGRCVAACAETQSVHAIAFAGRGARTRVTSFMDKGLANSPCIQCGQCSVVCPTAAITEKDQSSEVMAALADPRLTMIIQTAPAIRASLGEALGMPPGSLVTGKMVAALRRLGFAKIFDTQFSADLTIMEEGTEFIQRVQTGGTLPMITSCSPGWINFIETFYPELLSHLSSCKSPQQMFGAVAKTFYAQKTGIDPASLRVVSIMPCTAKKGEAGRPEMDSAYRWWREKAEKDGTKMSREHYRDVDWAITTRELARMIRQSAIDMASLPEENFDSSLGESTGAATIFGNTGGVMEAALRTVYEILEGKALPQTDFLPVRGLQGIKTAEVPVAGMKVKVAVAHGLKNARVLLDDIAAGKSDYHFIEVMACPGGCIGGGGQPVLPDIGKKLARNRSLYMEDLRLLERKSHQNAEVSALYKEFLGQPAGHLSHELLHTKYKARIV
ncbi:MAG TPA: [FeFe] hydrogenase, group A [Spirochaetales bacterium]|nr:[FeFe] hydrogenase, group A [Spirochaetales bacterium]